MRVRCARIAVGAFMGGVALSGAAQAAEDGFYIGAAAGVNFPRDSKFDITANPPKASFDAGFGGTAAAGFGFGTGLRLEGEFGYRDNDVDDVQGSSSSGEVSAITFMGNILYDIDLGRRLTPYLGVGVGVAHVDFDDVDPVGGSVVDDDDTSFAFQGIVGAAFDISDRFKVTLDYRYLEAPDLDLTTDAGASADSDYRTHTVMLGLRFSFGAPPPQPTPVQAPAAEPEPEPTTAPTPAPPAVRNFLVFFDVDKSDLTPEALSIIASAADTALQAAPVRIELTGHADRAGPRPYNQGLSQRRADAVAAELVRLGVPKSDIGVTARGEDDPLVPTPDGIREPQNRRVEIVLE